MKRKLLSICIPVYNREKLFKICLIEACEASLKSPKEVEIVVSDNASEEDLFCIVKNIRLKYKTIDIIYHRNNHNIGACMNVLKVVNIASGKYCWVIGSDDFIKCNGIKTIVDIINDRTNVNFICCNYDIIMLKEVVDKHSDKYTYSKLHNQLKDKKFLIPHKAPSLSKEVNKLNELIDPKYNNVLLGAIMTGIFKKSLWDKVDKSMISDGFNKLENIYPHCYIYANSFIGEKAFYCGEPVITVGEGAREWTTDKVNDFWHTSLPLIYLNILGEMVETYKKFGLEIKQYYRCKKFAGGVAGNYFLPMFIRKHILKTYVKDAENINLKKIFIYYRFTQSFYRGILKGILFSTLLTMKKILKKRF